MNTENALEGNEGNVAVGASSTVLSCEARFAVRLLRKLEWVGLRTDHAKLAKTAQEWWVSEEDQVTGPMPFPAILRRLLEGAGSVTVMPVREEGEEHWRTLTYSPLWMRPGVARWWTIGFWVVMAVLGWCVVATVTPHQWERVAAIGYFGALAGGFLYRRFRPEPGAVLKFRFPKFPGLGKAGKRGLSMLLVGAVCAVLIQRVDWSGVSLALDRLDDGEAGKREPVLAEASKDPVDDLAGEAVIQDGTTAEVSPVGEAANVGAADSRDALAALAGKQLPTRVRLREPVQFSVMKRSGTWGKVEAPAGLEVALAGVEGGRLRLRLRDGTALVRVEATDVLARVSQAAPSVAVAGGVESVDLPDAAELMGAGARAVIEAEVVDVPDFSIGSTTEDGRLDHRQDADATGDGAVAGDDVRTVGFTAADLGIVPAVPGATSSEPHATAMATDDAWGEGAGAGAEGDVARGSLGGTAKLTASDDPASYGSRVPVKDAEVAAALERAGGNREQLEQALATAPGPDMDLLIAKARQYDLVNLKASHLVNTVKLARQARASVPWSRAIPDPVWTEFVLPYRIADEDLDDWRPEFQAKLQPEIAKCRDSKSAVLAIHQWLWKGDEGKAFVEFAVSESRDQSPRQLLNTTKVGRCFELNLLFTALLRSSGIPARLTGTSWWGNRDFYHYWVEYWDSEKRAWDYIEGAASNPDTFMGKNVPMPAVYALPGFCPVIDPIGRERWDAMIDVSDRYRKPGSIAVSVPSREYRGPVTYTAYVWNLSAWRSVAVKTSEDGAVFELGPNKVLPYLVTASAGGKIGMELVDVKEAARVAKELSMNAANGQGQVVALKQPEKVATR